MSEQTPNTQNDELPTKCEDHAAVITSCETCIIALFYAMETVSIKYGFIEEEEQTEQGEHA